MARKLRPDRVLFFVTLLLLFCGLAMVFSASAVTAKERLGDPNYFFVKQLAAAAIGMAVMFVVMRVDYHRYRNPAFVFSALSVTFCLLVLVYFLKTAANTHRWISLTVVNFQPSELAKIVLIIFLAYFLEVRRGRVDEFKQTLLPVGAIVGAMAGLIVFQPDLGTAVALVAVTTLLLFVGGMGLRWLALAAVLATPAFYFLVIRVKWRRDRLLAFIDPWGDPLDRGFHMIQSLISVGAGGIAGKGFMEGRQKLFYLPEAHTDFIFAVVGEELGLIGTSIILTLFVVFFWRGIRASRRAPDQFGMYLALGITVMIAVQAFINISVVLGLMPTKGIPLPFVSYGGSSVVMMLASVGILLNVSQQGS